MVSVSLFISHVRRLRDQSCPLMRFGNRQSTAHSCVHVATEILVEMLVGCLSKAGHASWVKALFEGKINQSLMSFHCVSYCCGHLMFASCLIWKFTFPLCPRAHDSSSREKGLGFRVSLATLKVLQDGWTLRKQNQEKESKTLFEPLGQAASETHYLSTVGCMKHSTCMCVYIFIFAQVILCSFLLLFFYSFFGGGGGVILAKEKKNPNGYPYSNKHSYVSSPIATLSLSSESHLCRHGGFVLNLCKGFLLRPLYVAQTISVFKL